MGKKDWDKAYSSAKSKYNTEVDKLMGRYGIPGEPAGTGTGTGTSAKSGTAGQLAGTGSGSAGSSTTGNGAATGSYNAGRGTNQNVGPAYDPDSEAKAAAADKAAEALFTGMKGLVDARFAKQYTRPSAVSTIGCRFNRYKNIHYGAVSGGLRSVFFMVMPQLYLFSEDVGEPKIANWITLGETSFMQKYEAPSIAAQLDLYGGDRLRQKLGGAYKSASSTEIGLFLSGNVTECALPDMEVNLMDTANNIRGKNVKIAGGGGFMATDTSVSISIRNDSSGYAKALIRIWLMYIMGCKSGKVQPRIDDIILNRVCYSTSAFVVNLEPDGETIADITEIMMMYPTTFPSSQGGHTKSLKNDEEFTVNFYAGAIMPHEDSLYDKLNFRLNLGAITTYENMKDFHVARQKGSFIGHIIDDPYHKLVNNDGKNLSDNAFNYPLSAKLVYIKDIGKYKLVYGAEGVALTDSL